MRVTPSLDDPARTRPAHHQTCSDEQRQQAEFESLEIEAAVLQIKRDLAAAKRGEALAQQAAKQQAKAHSEALEAIRKQVSWEARGASRSQLSRLGQLRGMRGVKESQ